MAGTIVVERTDTIQTTPEALLPYIAELPRWVDWSPWEGMDPALKREYTGEPGAVGSTYEWSGNRKAGAGKMRIESVQPDGVGVALDFTRPFKSSSHVRFLLTREGDRTRVIWRMESARTFFSRFFNLDKLIGPDFEKGLRRLKMLVES
ncbi:SRPBCC family protein [Leifsonia sp. P73]|uniref:SRPBCC family protein n=1 Tax=Leifsonia sp. P73 TaxID=3423959 RepID=UPI003DA57463